MKGTSEISDVNGNDTAERKSTVTSKMKKDTKEMKKNKPDVLIVFFQ